MKTVFFITRLMPKKSEIEVYESSSLKYCSAGEQQHSVKYKFFNLQRGKVYYSIQSMIKCPH